HPVPDTGFGQQITRLLLVRLDLSADAADIRPDVVRLFAVLGAPDGLQDLPVGQHLAGVACEIGEYVVLFRCQANIDAIPTDTVRAEVDFEPLRPVRRKWPRGSRTDTPKRRPYTSQQLF